MLACVILTFINQGFKVCGFFYSVYFMKTSAFLTVTNKYLNFYITSMTLLFTFALHYHDS